MPNQDPFRIGPPTMPQPNLVGSPIAPDFPTPMPEPGNVQALIGSPAQPTREGSVEYSPDFRKKAADAMGINRGMEESRRVGTTAGELEAGFTIPRIGAIGKVNVSPNKEGRNGSMRQDIAGWEYLKQQGKK